MLAYNGTFWWLGFCFLIIIPLVFLMPGRPAATPSDQVAE
jgi:hypothetical protein